MPIYEFRCNSCQHKISLFVKGITESLSPTCPTCGGKDLTRLVSSFAYRKSESTRLEEAGEPQMVPGPDYYKDPRNIGRWAEKKFDEMGMEMPPQLQEEIQAAREGEMPGSLKDLKSGPTEV